MNRKQLINELHKRLDAPFKEFMSAAKRYAEQPSILRGARRQEARDLMDEAIKATAEYALENWGLPPEEFNELVDEMRCQ